MSKYQWPELPWYCPKCKSPFFTTTTFGYIHDKLKDIDVRCFKCEYIWRVEGKQVKDKTQLELELAFKTDQVNNLYTVNTKLQMEAVDASSGRAQAYKLIGELTEENNELAISNSSLGNRINKLENQKASLQSGISAEIATSICALQVQKEVARRLEDESTAYFNYVKQISHENDNLKEELIQTKKQLEQRDKDLTFAISRNVVLIDRIDPLVTEISQLKAVLRLREENDAHLGYSMQAQVDEIERNLKKQYENRTTEKITSLKSELAFTIAKNAKLENELSALTSGQQTEELAILKDFVDALSNGHVMGFTHQYEFVDNEDKDPNNPIKMHQFYIKIAGLVLKYIKEKNHLHNPQFVSNVVVDIKTRTSAAQQWQEAKDHFLKKIGEALGVPKRIFDCTVDSVEQVRKDHSVPDSTEDCT